ncbi:hypothetical protein JCM33374_g2335 [Metschnikowia sp. JCM 33374]|nr:hypothetical protein JCM33374_g2335 [Metschnikowia sp. JCM 33374]
MARPCNIGLDVQVSFTSTSNTAGEKLQHVLVNLSSVVQVVVKPVLLKSSDEVAKVGENKSTEIPNLSSV